MLLSLSKISIFIMIIYMNFFQYVFFKIPGIYVILGGLSLVSISVYILEKGKNIKLGFPIEINILWLFTFISFFSGYIVCSSYENFMNQIIIWIQTLLLTINIIYICRIENNTDFIKKVFLVLSFMCAIKTVYKGEVYQNAIFDPRISMTSNYNPNDLGLVLIIGILICILNLECTKLIFKKFIYLILIFLFFYVILKTGSRKSLIGATMIFVPYIFIMLKNNMKDIYSVKNIINLIVVTIVIYIGIKFIINNMQDSLILDRLMRLLFNNTETKRSSMYREAIELFKQNPIFGVGFNNFRNVSSFGTYSHSTYAEVLSCTGMVGSVIYFYSIGIIIYKSIKLVNYKRNTINSVYIFMILTILFLATTIILIYDILYYCFIALIISHLNIELDKVKLTRRCSYEKDKYTN